VKIGIFDPYLDTLGGGEKYMLSAASCLSSEHDVSIFWDDKTIGEKAKIRFGIDLTKVHFAKNIFSSSFPLWERVFQSMQFDRIFYLSDGSIPVIFPKKLFIHFQYPVEWVNGKSIPNALKMQHVAGVICNSLFTKNHIDKTFGIKSQVLYPPSSGEYTLQTIKKRNMILSVGRYGKLPDGTTFKKQEFIIETFKKLLKKGLKQWKLILVISFKEEDTENVKMLKKSTEGFPIQIIENADNVVLQKLYGEAKIYWHAAGFGENLTAHPEMAEHFGIATVQAMEAGAVPVVINAGGQKEIVTQDKNGYLWNSQEECMGQTISVIKNKHVWERLSKDAREKAKDFSMGTFCQTVSTIMR